MPGSVSDESGRLGYCWMHHFKCHSARSCDTWATGGPIKEDKVSYEWQKKGRKVIIRVAHPKMKKYLKDHPYMEPNALQDGPLEEEWSKSERKKRKSKCDNPKGFTMKQFCKNQKSKSKKGERKNEQMELDEKCQKGYKTHPKRKTKIMFGKRYRNCVKAKEGRIVEADPKKGTGKKPKGSGRRLYTDENPKDTVSVEFFIGFRPSKRRYLRLHLSQNRTKDNLRS